MRPPRWIFPEIDGEEIPDEFYPRNKNLLEQQTGAVVQSPGNAELCARICELALLLGYNAAKTKMLVGQWRLDLVGLERNLQHELDEGPQPPPENRGDNRFDVSSDPDERKATRPSTSGSLIEGYGGCGLCSEAPSGNWYGGGLG